MYDPSWFAYVCDDEDDQKGKAVCDHHKVYAEQREGPYPWICTKCLGSGADEYYPICNSKLFEELQKKATPGSTSSGEARLRNCYYCGKVLHGAFGADELPRCGKCI